MGMAPLAMVLDAAGMRTKGILEGVLTGGDGNDGNIGWFIIR